MRDTNGYAVGDRVWWVDKRDGNVKNGIIEDFLPNGKSAGYLMVPNNKCLAVINSGEVKDGLEVTDCVDVFRCYSSEQECFNSCNDDFTKAVEDICDTQGTDLKQ